jgi:hypothetical protein
MSETNHAVLQYEILEEKAQALGRTSRQIIQTLEALRRYDQNPNAEHGRPREELVVDAAERAHYFLIQRELCGFRDWPEVAEYYSIPAEVLSRMGSCRMPPACEG